MESSQNCSFDWGSQSAEVLSALLTMQQQSSQPIPEETYTQEEAQQSTQVSEDGEKVANVKFLETVLTQIALVVNNLNVCY